MNILFDIGHPAHVHYYRNLAVLLGDKGHRVFWTTKPVKSAIDLLEAYNFEFKVLPRKRDNIAGKIFLQLFYDLIVLTFCLKKNIDIAIGTSVTVAHVSRLSRVKSIVFDDDDDDVQPLVKKYVHPFTDALLSPEPLKPVRQHRDTIFYPGYHELAYLHPRRFTPDSSVLAELGLNEGDTYFVLRFNVFKAHHDKGITGLLPEQKIELVRLLETRGKVFITTERETDPELKRYSIKARPEKIHSLMYYATMFIGDSQTMTSEAAVMGVPSIRCNSFAGRIAYLEEQELRYGLTFAFTPDRFPQMLEKISGLLSEPDLRGSWKLKREKMLSEKIDVTSFWLWFIENFPESKHTTGKDNDFFKKFI